MKIAVVHSFYSTKSPSGENTVVELQIDALRRAGHETLLVDRRTDNVSTGLAQMVSGTISAAGLGGVSPGGLLREFSPDVVHVHNLFPNWSTTWLKDWSSKMVATLHNHRSVCASALLWRDGSDCTLCLDGSSFNAVRHKCYRGSSAATVPLAFATRARGRHSAILNRPLKLIVLNEGSRLLYSSLMPGRDIRVIPNFVGQNAVQRTVPVEEQRWIYVGRLTPEKGLRWLLEHWPAGPGLDIVGSGSMEQEIVAHSLTKQGQIRFLGRMTPGEVKGALAKSLGLVLPSLWSEGLPTVALEALASGTPVAVSSKCSSAVELTRNSSGSVFDVMEDGASLARAIARVEVGGSAMRDAALKQFQYHYSESAWLSSIEDCYDSVVHGQQ